VSIHFVLLLASHSHTCTVQGYARDVIRVVEDDTGETVEALLYRGTPDNPAFWPRAIKDLPFAAGMCMLDCLVQPV
jgi:hypothetical protein